jgi:two-component system, NarL family, response regulator NreC
VVDRIADSTRSSESVTRFERAGLEDDGAVITIVLADDHAMVRSALHSVLDAAQGFDVVAEAADLDTAVRKVLAYKPAVLMLDFDMPGASIVEAIPKFRAVSSGTAIVVLTVDAEPEAARAAMRAGALGFVLKEAADTELIAAVRAAAQGRGYLAPELGARVVIEPEPIATRADGLSARELDVLRLVALGYTNPEIAQHLHLSIRTVEAHRGHLRHKLHQRSRAELCSYARQRGLVK